MFKYEDRAWQYNTLPMNVNTFASYLLNYLSNISSLFKLYSSICTIIIIKNNKLNIYHDIPLSFINQFQKPVQYNNISKIYYII